MNYIKTMPFIILISVIYYLFGSFIVDLLPIRKNRFAAKYVFGYFAFFLLGWFVGYPCLLKGTSWLFFTLLFWIIIFVLMGLMIFRHWQKKDLRIKKEQFLTKVRKNLHQYWFVYLMVIVFTLLSVTNMQPYMKNNYTDDHYIVKMVHMYKSPHLFNMASGDGFIRTLNQNLVALQGYRKYNTYELVYTAMAGLFGIDIPFFCRFSMTAVNYAVIFLSFVLISGIFLEENIAQYATCSMCVFMLPAGFLARNPSLLHIRMFEVWRFQTAIYMGGSITRLLSIPIFMYIIYCGYQTFIKEITFKGIAFYVLLIAGFAISILSFQTTAISYVLLMLPFIIFAFVITLILKVCKQKRKIYYMIIACTIFIAIVITSDYCMKMLSISNALNSLKINTLGLDMESLQSSARGYSMYYNDTFVWDIFGNFSFFVLALDLYLFKNRDKRLMAFYVLLLFLLFKLDKSNMFLSLISFTFFNTARMLTAVLTVCVLFWGITGIKIMQNAATLLKNDDKSKALIHSYVTTGITALVIFACFGALFFTEQKKFIKYTKDGDAQVKEGYSLKPLISNDQMLPQPFVDVGKYFDKLSEGYYPIVMEEKIKYRGHMYSYQHLLLASHKIVRYDFNLAFGDLTPQFYKNMWPIQNYIQEAKDVPQTYQSIAPALKATKIKYIFTTREKIAKDLSKHGFKCVCGGNEKAYWLMYASKIKLA